MKVLAMCSKIHPSKRFSCSFWFFLSIATTSAVLFSFQLHRLPSSIGNLRRTVGPEKGLVDGATLDLKKRPAATKVGTYQLTLGRSKRVAVGPAGPSGERSEVWIERPGLARER